MDNDSIRGRNTTESVDIKTLILWYIDKTPGIRYRELLRLSGLTNGAVEYHLKILESTHKVKVDRQDGKRARYYPIYIRSDESHILGHMRNQAAREIVIFILEHDLCTFSEILEHMKKAPSTVSWHLKRLSDAGIILVTFGQNFHLYRVTNSKFVRYVLDKYKESFRDKVANQYYEIFGDL